ncbi:MAG: alpha/beta fold hydrolase [Ardenticatenaceae bacterium]
MPFQKLKFTNSTGQALSARIDLPADGTPIAYALFAHCFTCSKNLRAVNRISRSLTQEGIAVLRFDFTGLGQSEGDFADTNFSSNVADLIAAADFLEKEFEGPQILIGHSLGGAAVLQAAAHIPSSVAVATIGAPCDPYHVTHLLRGSIERIEADGEAEVLLAGRKFRIKKQFLDDLERTNMENIVRRLRKALLIFHSPIDNTVSVENARCIFETAKHPKSFVSLDHADHLLTDDSDALYVGSVLAAWARKYIKAPPPKTEPVVPASQEVVARIGRAKYRTDITARSGHHMIADEAIRLGGMNLGPDPFDYLMAALGACTTITLRMYADRKGWPLEGAIIRLEHDRIKAEECDECKTKKGRVDKFDRVIELIGPLDEAQRKRLLQIANKCPVHRAFHSEILVHTRLKE